MGTSSRLRPPGALVLGHMQLLRAEQSHSYQDGTAPAAAAAALRCRPRPELRAAGARVGLCVFTCHAVSRSEEENCGPTAPCRFAQSHFASSGGPPITPRAYQRGTNIERVSADEFDQAA